MKRVSPQEAHALQQQGWVYLDVRSTPEFEQGHPEGARLVPLLEAGAQGLQPNPRFLDEVRARFPLDTRLVIGCAAGGRSLQAAHLLVQVGYVEVVDQRAGFGGARDGVGNVVERGWREAGLPLATGAEKA